MKKILYMLNKRKANRFTKKAIALITSIAVLLVSLPYVDMSSFFDDIPFLRVHAASPRHASLTFTNLDDFAVYSVQYNMNSDTYCGDEITLALNTGATNTFPSNYIPLGTEENPFNGKIYINQTYGAWWWFETEKPLFGYIADSAVINYYDQAHNTEAIQIELRRKENSEITPLFANHVTEGGSTKSTWKIKSGVQVQSSDSGSNYLVCNYSGLIGSMDKNASVNVEYDNSAIQGDNRSDVVSSDDVGLICGSMKSGSKIKLTLTGSNNGCHVTSSNGNAGGLVGSMGAGSELEINSSYTPSTSRMITASNGYAGGIVGYNNGGKITFSTTSTETEIRGTITGKDGAGGICGYYTNFNNNTPQSDTFDLRNYDINCTVKAASAGGIAGVVNGTADMKVDGSKTGANEITVAGDTVTEFGGIFGNYQTSVLTNTLDVDTVTANTSASFAGTSYYGGVAGNISGNSAAYINVDNFTHKSSAGFNAATAFGGVVGNAGDKGSMLDVGAAAIETGVVAETAADGTPFNGGGIVGVLNYGVLRLSGTTDLTKAPANAGHDYGQLVGIRKDSLVYAVGSGDNNNTGWTFNRSNTDVQADDIGTWGSVIRIADIESNVLTFDSTTHTVTVKAPVKTNMETAADFTKTALNMQLNNVEKGSLLFADSTNTKTTLLSSNLSVKSGTTINLSGTGNIGLMRDDYNDSLDEIGVYTGALTGGTVNLAIGERYGVYSGSTPVGRGAIMAHRYNGLIAITDAKSITIGEGESAVTTYTLPSITDLTVGGTINVNSKLNGTYVGGIVASVRNGISVTSCIASETINFNAITRTGDTSDLIIGGMIGDIHKDNTHNISITYSTASPTIKLTGVIGDGTAHSAGGVIGRINSEKAFEINVNTLSVGTQITTTGITSYKDIVAAGFIGHIVSSSNTRTMNLTGLTVSGASISNTATEKPGGLLGHSWYDTDVNYTANNGLIVSGTNILTTSAKYVGGIVNTATGHWTVPEKGIKISGATTLSDFTNSLGLLVHDAYSGAKGLYLEFTHKDSYDLGAGLTVPATTRYDDIAVSTGSDVLANGSKGIISITTDGDLIMNGTSCNTYQNKYNKGNLTNDKSRYYYNLTSICAKETKSAGEKLLLWSLNKYAATNINSNFTDSFGANDITGTFNMEHLSYYPIDVDSAVTIGDATFQFYNEEIERSEAGTGNSDAVISPASTGVRTTRGASQHYLMHSGVFRNVSSTLTTSGNIHFKGDIGVGSITTGTDETIYSGALINGTLSGTLTTAPNKEIVFEGMTISDPTKYLLINKLSTNSKLTLSGVRTGGGKNFSNVVQSTETAYAAGATVASSLIGDVSGNGIQVSFERMKLDSRTSAGSPADWSAQYGTTKSIFSGATFLNKFAVDNNSTGTYNFEEIEDWDSGTHNANVTYGLEIKTSKEYESKQQKYYDETDPNFVDPVTQPSSSRTEVYPFDSKFLPYVKESTAILGGDPLASLYTTRELKVNVRVNGITEGCGTYNHPYEITTGTQLIDVANAINKTGYPGKLRLPKINGYTFANAISTHWCESKTDCAEFKYESSNYTCTVSGTTYNWTEDQVSFYLASAYYIIKDDIEITGTYVGLGASPANDTTGKYAFRGVIVGAKSDGSVKISMSIPKTQGISGNNNFENTSGLITMSNGCVVKNLTIEVTPYTTDKYNYKVNGNQAYGYDEKFPNYGAVINKIMGGDNIIDNVSVDFIGSFKVVNSNDYKATVGGYVGCVVNGGLIFRNVDDDNLTTTTVTTVNNVENRTSVQGFKVIKVNGNGVQQDVKIGDNVICSSSVDGSMTDEDDLIHIHVNPFVGRVINGYAIRETDSYAFSEDGATYGDGESRANAVEVTMHNTRKNYSIPDIDTTNTNKLTFSKSEGQTSYDTITVPDSQALYIMSIIAQSGSGCASSDDGEYAYNISYCGTTGRNYTGNTPKNNKATHWADYSNVGTATSTTDSDYVLSKNDTVNSKKAVPYIIYKYTSSYSNSGTKYPARTLTKRTFYVNLVGGTTYYLPDSFRGIGFLGSAEYVNDNMKIYGFNGNGTKAKPTIIDLNAEYYTHKHDNDPYYGGNSIAMVCGMGLFNSLQQFTSESSKNFKYETDSKYQITNFALQGYISAHHVWETDQKTNNVITAYAGEDCPAQNESGVLSSHFCTAGFVSYINNENIKLFNISDVNFMNFHVNSYSYAGGFFAYTNNSSVRMYINNCNADGFKIEGSGRVGGFVGSYDSNKATEGGIHINTGLDSNGKDTFTSVMKNTIINNRLTKDVKANYSAGIVGSVYCTQNASITDQGDHALGTLILRNVTIEGGNAETNYMIRSQAPQQLQLR